MRALVAGVLVFGPEEFVILAGADPESGLPVWLHAEFSDNLIDQIGFGLRRGFPGHVDEEDLDASLSLDVFPRRVSVMRLRAAARQVVAFALGG